MMSNTSSAQNPAKAALGRCKTCKEAALTYEMEIDEYPVLPVMLLKDPSASIPPSSTGKPNDAASRLEGINVRSSGDTISMALTVEDTGVSGSMQ